MAVKMERERDSDYLKLVYIFEFRGKYMYRPMYMHSKIDS